MLVGNQGWNNLSSLFRATMRLTREEGLATYGVQALSKIVQRESISLIVPIPSVCSIFLHLEAIIHRIVDNPRIVAALGNNCWKIVKEIASPLRDDLHAIVVDQYSNAFDDEPPMEQIAAACDLALRYYLLSVRTKDHETMLNNRQRRDGTEKLTFRQKVASRLLSTNPVKHEEEILQAISWAENDDDY